MKAKMVNVFELFFCFFFLCVFFFFFKQGTQIQCLQSQTFILFSHISQDERFKVMVLAVLFFHFSFSLWLQGGSCLPLVPCFACHLQQKGDTASAPFSFLFARLSAQTYPSYKHTCQIALKHISHVTPCSYISKSQTIFYLSTGDLDFHI